MLLPILLLNHILLSLNDAGPADAKHGTEDFENLEEKLELRDMETRMQGDKEKLLSRLNEMEMEVKN